MTLKLRCDPSKLPTPKIPKPKLQKQKAPDIPYEAENRQERLKKRKWNLVNRGINNGKYGTPVYWTPERNAVLAKLRLEGKTYKQIGDELGKSSDSIRRQWYNIRDGRAQTK